MDTLIHKARWVNPGGLFLMWFSPPNTRGKNFRRATIE